ncbi:MAG: NAD-dependent epimerase/dehydratase family protein [Candidatus Falkowbacteria bacterium]|nr:NAD-dependent epimerase/dehydratase family protein [Candidatus Falkowbacteria bacterium]
MSKILITGGAGFIGSNLVDVLISAGYQVVIIDNLVTGKKEYLNPQAKFYQADICSSEIAAIFTAERFDYVYHLAAQIEVAKSVADPVYDNAVNILGALNILANCQKNKVKKIIFSSTGGAIYGEAEEIPTPETAPAYPVSPYGIHKLTFEKYLNYYYQIFGQDYAILRFANVYGPRQYRGGEAGVISIFIANAILNKTSFLYGDGQQTRDYVYVADVVKALVLVKDIEARGEINISTAREINLWQIIASIEKTLGQPIIIEQKTAKLGEQRRSCLSYERARTVLNWLPEVDLALGIKNTLAWAKDNKNNL